jgi:hypothetical protein
VSRGGSPLRVTRRRLLAALGLALASAAGCGPSKDDARPNPDLGPPPNHEPPKRREGPPAPGNQKP